jgi:hypothetical protein
MPGGRKLTTRQEAAISALLTEPTIQAAAARAKVSARTLAYWLKLPLFLAGYRQARMRIVEHAITQLQRATSRAVSTLSRNLRCGKATTEVMAASKILEFALGSIEQFDLAQRVAELEAQLAQQGVTHANLEPHANGRAPSSPGR